MMIVYSISSVANFVYFGAKISKVISKFKKIFKAVVQHVRGLLHLTSVKLGMFKFVKKLVKAYKSM